MTPDQLRLLTAVEQDKVVLVKYLLQTGIDPNFFDSYRGSPLQEAIRNNNIKIVRALVQGGADINLRKPGQDYPLDLAEAMAYVTNDHDIVKYLKRRKALCVDDDRDADGFPNWMNKNFGDPSAAPAPKPARLRKEPAFKKDTLQDVFNAEKWVGRVDEMEKLWEKVPAKLKKDFDFAAALSGARLATLKQRRNQDGHKSPRLIPPGQR